MQGVICNLQSANLVSTPFELWCERPANCNLQSAICKPSSLFELWCERPAICNLQFAICKPSSLSRNVTAHAELQHFLYYIRKITTFLQFFSFCSRCERPAICNLQFAICKPSSLSRNVTAHAELQHFLYYIRRITKFL